MNLIDRVKNILLTPKTEWPVIAAEPANRNDLIVKYVLVLAAIPAVISFLFSLAIGMFFGGMGIFFASAMFVYQLVMAILMVFVVAFIIDLFAPNFGSTKDFDQSLKVAAYSFTPAWIAGIVAFIPVLGWLVALAGIVYAVYQIYLGLLLAKKSPEDKSVIYTVAVVAVSFVFALIVGGIGGCISTAAALATAKVSGGGLLAGAASSYQREKTKAKLDDFSKKIEAANQKLDAANKSGDANQQAAAAVDVLGTVLSGGRKVEPLSVEEVKAFIPEKFAGLSKTSSSAERSGPDSLKVTTAKASYGDASGKQVRLEVTDSGGAGAMLGLAGWMGALDVEKEDDNGSERTKKEGGRIVHERISKRGGDNEYSLVVADRFMVKAAGGVDLPTLKAGVSGLDLGKLESMKDAGVAKK
ncbi:hypothetical protein BWI17_02765 [Betaproteobacteria bacterium GR16-43]|nr:hypothetical protein BWI17_02765 [Betaproteobacteria bacterium GR16-43]